MTCVMVPSSGSSPPVRGARHERSCLTPRGGLIPARAGSTAATPAASAAAGAHPRPCGEHHVREIPQNAPPGSSPPVRGAHPLMMPTDWAAHPRPCGEHVLNFMAMDYHQGSSPPVRGAHLLTWGFIPYTGKIGLLWSQSLRPEYTINNCS